MSEVRSPLVRGGVLEPGGRWRNWGRSESAHPQYVATVASVDEVIETVVFARDEGLTVKPIGAGHSFTAIGATTGVQVDLSAIDGVLGVDGNRVTLGAEANYLSRWVFDVAYTNFFGGGNFNLIHDRDFVQIAARYSF